MKVAIIGAGSWGSAAAWLLGGNGHEVSLWARDAQLIKELNATHHNPRYLADIQLPPQVLGQSDLQQALAGADAIVLATPSKAVRQSAAAISQFYQAGTALVLLSKGVENTTGLLLADVVAEELASVDPQAAKHIAILSGPNHAEEVAKGMLSGTVIASKNPEVARLFQTLFCAKNFRAYTSADTIGVQLCGAAKNVVAIAAGIVAGLELGDNTTAVLMTRGLAEISRLVEACGGQSQTCMGLAGMGDLVVTCTSRHSRNRSFGLALAAGQTLEDYQQQTHMVVEGSLACLSVTNLAREKAVEMPVCEQVRSIVWESSNITQMIDALMARSAKPEFY